jgi:MFS family permease
MMIFSVIFLSQAILEIPTGLLSDFIGRRKTLLIGAFSVFLALFFYALGINIWVLVLGAVFEGLGRSLFSGTAKALLYETLQESKRVNEFDSIFGKTSSMEQLALGLSAALGGLLTIISLSFVMWVAVIPQFLCFLCAFFFIEPKHLLKNQDNPVTVLKSSFQGIIKNRRLRLVSIAEVLGFGFGEANFYFQSAFFKMLIPEWLIGLVRSINHLFGAISFWYAGRMIKHFGNKKILIGGNVINTLLKFFALVFPSMLSPFIMAVTNLTYGSTSTARNTLMQREFSDAQRSTMDSIVSLGGSLLFSIVAVFLGYIADVSSPIYAMLVGLSSNIVIIWIYTLMFPTKPHTPLVERS